MAKEQIRVAHIIGKWLGGGVEAVVMNYYRNIDRNQIQFDFICDDDSTNIPYEEIEKLGGRVILIPPYQKPFQYHRNLKKILKNGGYKIVHSHINTMSVFPLFAAFMAKVPVRIAHSHSTTNKKEWKKNLLKQILRPFSKLFATNYFSCTEHAGKWMFGKKTYEKGNVYVLNNAIDLDKFKYNKSARDEMRKELNISDDTLVIGHIGRFVQQKNHNFLVDIYNEIYKKNANSKLLLIGQGPLEKQIKIKVNDLELQNNVIFLGQRNDVDKLYQAMDLFLFPSLYEGLGMVLIEAQCAGLKCICSTEVPNVAKVTDNIDFLNLNVSSKIWTEVCLKNLNDHERKSFVQEVSKYGYNIKQEVHKLEKYYLESCGTNGKN